MSETPRQDASPENGFPIERVCSYCEKEMGFKYGGAEPGEITHGVCDDCYIKVMDEWARKRQKKAA